MSEEDEATRNAVGLATLIALARKRALDGELPAEFAQLKDILGDLEKRGAVAPAEAIRMRHVLQGETDRGCALVAAAYLDEELEKLLRAFFIEDDKAVDELFGNDAPLGAFSARIKLAFALGLIRRDIRRELDFVRKIRNKFAHVSEDLTFDSPPIRDWCLQLTDLTDRPRDDARFRFTGNIMRLAAAIHGAVHRIAKGSPARRTEPPPTAPLGEEEARLMDLTATTLREIFLGDTSTHAPDKAVEDKGE